MFKFPPHPILTPMPLFLIGLLCFLPAAFAQDKAVPLSDAAIARAHALADSLLGKLTLEEKVSLCHGDGTMSINPVPNIGLTGRFWMSDGPNNVRVDLNDQDFRESKPESDPSVQSTALPRLSVLAATWDRNLAYTYGRVIGEEARARGKDMMLGPGVNIVRTPLCGRNMEYFGEDPFLVAHLVVPEIEGIQSCNVAACVKHFALNSQELNRFSVDAAVDDRTLHEIYLPAFEAAVKEARVLAVMGAYNRFRGVFCCESDLLLNQILKKQWGFQGLVVSDWGATHSTSAAALGGLDVEMHLGSGIHWFKEPLVEAVKSGAVPVSVLDDKVRRILFVMAAIHKIDGNPRLAGSINTPEHQAIARKIAEDGIVLLKNDRGVLPLDQQKIKSILVIGKNALTPTANGGGSSAGNPPYEITPLDGIRKLAGSGVPIDVEPLDQVFTTARPDAPAPAASSPSPGGVPAPLKKPDETGVWKQEFFDSMDCTGPVAKTDFMPGRGFEWGRSKPPGSAASWSARISAGIPVTKPGEFAFRLGHDGGARLLVNGKAIAEDWTPDSYRVTSGTFVATGTESFQFAVEYRHDDRQPGIMNLDWHTPLSKPSPDLEALAKRARSADCVLFFCGDSLGGREAGESEGSDRPGMDLPEGTSEAVEAVLAANPNTVVVNQSGAPVAMPWAGRAHTMVQYGFSGMEGGSALARVLFGQVNPSGKLAVTFPKQLADSPAHALGDYNGTRVDYAEGVMVGYRWFDAKGIEPLFPFGYGLSYTTFEIKHLSLPASRLRAGSDLTATVEVANTGSREGAEVVQLYVGDPSAGVPRPPRELKGFEKVSLKPGETKTVRFNLRARDFSYWDQKTGGWKIDPGVFSISVGDSSRNTPVRAEVTVTPPDSKPG
jgi:beta-glucosidase